MAPLSPPPLETGLLLCCPALEVASHLHPLPVRPSEAAAAKPPPVPERPARKSEAFTLEFSDEESNRARVVRLAAKPTAPSPPQRSFQRRGGGRASLGNRAAPPPVAAKARRSYAGPPATAEEGASFLINKLLTSTPTKSESGESAEETRELDTVSEAGTYVVGRRDSSPAGEEEAAARAAIPHVFGIPEEKTPENSPPPSPPQSSSNTTPRLLASPRDEEKAKGLVKVRYQRRKWSAEERDMVSFAN